MRTPLAIIKLTIQEMPDLPQITKQKAEILEEIARAVEITKETLIISDGAAKEQHFRSTDINDTIEHSLKLIPKTHSFSVNLNLNPVPTINAVTEDLEIVFTNLMNNAIEAMKEKGGGIITISTYTENNEIIIKFADTGKGIPDEFKAKIWEPYVSGFEQKVGNANAGRGWGLTIVNRIIQEHHGVVTLESTEGKGTTFTIRLPV